MTERVDQVQRAFSAYAVERELGSGGMATVYLAQDKKHDRKVAIKILHAELAPDAVRIAIEVASALDYAHRHGRLLILCPN